MDSRHGEPAFPAGSRMTGGPQLFRRMGWLAVTGAAATAAVLALCGVTVGAGQAVVMDVFGSPYRVLTRPGFYLNWPAPAGTTMTVDMRVHTTLGTLRGVTMRDGQQLDEQAFVAWRVPDDAEAIKTFVRSTMGNTEAVAGNIEGLLDSAVPSVTAGFATDELLNSNPRIFRLAEIGGKLKDAVGKQAREAFGVEVLHAGIARLMLPDATLAATEARMRAQREAEAAERIAKAQMQAAEIRAEAARDSRIAVAEAQTEAANIEASAATQAADIQAKAYSADPDLYLMLRSLDTLSTMVGPGTRLVLRTDAAPFNLLVQGPPTEAGK